MFARIKTFSNNSPSGGQYLFTKNDFHLLQLWAVWMVFNHQHISTFAPTTVTSDYDVDPIPGINVKMHAIGVHDDVPVGFTKSSTTSTFISSDGDSIPRSYLTLEDHVSNASIHTFPDGDGTTNDLSEGQLIARGWTEPIFVRAVISSPLFEVIGYGTKGPMIMPFPHHNMSPVHSTPHNTRNQMQPLSSSPATAPLYGYKKLFSAPVYPNGPYVSEMTIGKGKYFDTDLAVGTNWPHTIFSKGGFRQFEKEVGLGEFPYPQDAKSFTDSQFYSPFHEFLYMIPSYLASAINVDINFDLLTGRSFEDNNFAVFFHSPLFVDSRHTMLLDLIKRSGITSDEILNYKDLMGVFMRDVDKPDLFANERNYFHTCWLSKYKPVLVEDVRSDIGYGCALFLNEYDQEVNQFISQINYTGSLMRNIDKYYYDYPFKTVTVDFNVFTDIDDDPDLQSIFSGDSSSIRQHFANRGFPRCFYRTDFENYLSRAGGNVDDSSRPREDFYFNIYPHGLYELKEYLRNSSLLGSEVEHYYYDTLNLPYRFGEGKRQVMILKDPDVYRDEVLLKENPFSNLRTMAYVIIEGYVSVPYEIYATSFSASSMFGGGVMVSQETLIGDMTGGGNWKNKPSPDQEKFTFPPGGNGGGGDTSVPVVPSTGSGGGGGLDDETNIDAPAPPDDPISRIIPKRCEDPTALNYGQIGGCIYGTDPGTGGGSTDPIDNISPPISGGSGSSGAGGSSGGTDTTSTTAIIGSSGNPEGDEFGVGNIGYWISRSSECDDYRAGLLPRHWMMDYICCLEELGYQWYDFIVDTELEPTWVTVASTEEICTKCEDLFNCLKLYVGETMAWFILSSMTDCLDICDTSGW